MSIKVLYVTESGIAVPYLTICLNMLHADGHILLEHIPFGKFKIWQERLLSNDILIYQSLRDVENPVQDNIFLDCKKRKFLFDSCDMGSWDRFKKFDPSLPRIKNTPHTSIMLSHNIVLYTTFPVRRLRKVFSQRDLDISFRVKLRNDTRKQIRSMILDYQKKKPVSVEVDYVKRGYYPDHLTRVLISVNAPGNGEACIRHLLTLQAGSCMLAHESINGIKLLPNADIIDGEDYISFNFDNFFDKLDWLMSNRRKLSTISKNGAMKFQEGYSQRKTADNLLKLLR